MVAVSDKLKSKLEELVFLESLALNRCQLTSLDNLPVLPNLIQISLDNNSLKVLESFLRSLGRRTEEAAYLLETDFTVDSG